MSTKRRCRNRTSTESNSFPSIVTYDGASSLNPLTMPRSPALQPYFDIDDTGHGCSSTVPTSRHSLRIGVNGLIRAVPSICKNIGGYFSGKLTASPIYCHQIHRDWSQSGSASWPR